MKFRDLLNSDVTPDPDKQQRVAEQRFPDEVLSHGMKLWEPGAQVTPSGARVLLGVAAGYAVHDLELLDDIESSLRRGKLASVLLEVFDMGRMVAANDIEQYIPGIGRVVQSPVLGIWIDGVLVASLQGFAARNRLLKALHDGSLTG